MKKPLYIIKLGGSVITVKNHEKGVFRKAVVKRLVGEINEAKKKKDFDLILIHGAGSFAHPLAKKYKLDKGLLGKKTLDGFVQIEQNLLKLNSLVIGEFLKAKFKVCRVAPMDVIEAAEKKITEFDTRAITSLLNLGITPVLYGDVVFDRGKGFAVVSGDLIAAHLAEKLKAKKVVFVSDVDGVYDKNPKVYKDANLISHVNRSNYEEVIKNIKSHDRRDVTGEMAGKIMAIKNYLRRFEVQIVNGQKKDRVYNVLWGKETGTRVLLQ